MQTGLEWSKIWLLALPLVPVICRRCYALVLVFSSNKNHLTCIGCMAVDCVIYKHTWWHRHPRLHARVTSGDREGNRLVCLDMQTTNISYLELPSPIGHLSRGLSTNMRKPFRDWRKMTTCIPRVCLLYCYSAGCWPIALGYCYL